MSLRGPRLTSRLIEAGFTADEYIPTAVASEPTSKLSAHLKGLNTAFATTNRFKTIPTSYYTAIATDADTLAMSDTTDMVVGRPIRYTQSAVEYYGQIVAVVENDHIDIRGVALTTVTKLEVGPVTAIGVLNIPVEGRYGKALEDELLKVSVKFPVLWDISAGYCIFFRAQHSDVDTGTEAKVNVCINGSNRVSTNDSNLGIQLGAAQTWISNPATAINTSNYDIQFGEVLELECSAVGGTKDALNLTMQLVFIIP